MMYLKTNFDAIVPSNAREFEDSEVETMTEKQFDELPLCDQISIYNRFPKAYARLTGQAVPTDTSPTPQTDTQRAKTAVDEYEAMLDRIFEKVDSEHA